MKVEITISRKFKFLIMILLVNALFSDNSNGQSLPVVTSGKIIRLESFKSKYVDPRNIDVWLPDNYSESKKYPVIYMHDGQMLFDSSNTWNHQEWQVDEVLSELITNKEIKECIVVGIWNNGEYRHSEYFPQKVISNISEDEREIILKEQLMSKPQADNYLLFLTEELKPFIDDHFSTLNDRSNTFIMGSSMGGLISLYALCEYPKVFGSAACISTHWPLAKHELIHERTNEKVSVKFRDYLETNLPEAGSHRIYFDYGSETLDSLYKPHQLEVDKIMIEKGYSEKDWVTKEFPGEDHTEKAWSKRLSLPVRFLLSIDIE
jgi:predicted alpha/beta superfamily hydrolase